MCEFLIILHMVRIIICRSNFYSWHWLHNHLLCSSHTKLLHSLQMNVNFLSFGLGQMSEHI